MKILLLVISGHFIYGCEITGNGKDDNCIKDNCEEDKANNSDTTHIPDSLKFENCIEGPYDTADGGCGMMFYKYLNKQKTKIIQVDFYNSEDSTFMADSVCRSFDITNQNREIYQKFDVRIVEDTVADSMAFSICESPLKEPYSEKNTRIIYPDKGTVKVAAYLFNPEQDLYHAKIALRNFMFPVPGEDDNIKASFKFNTDGLGFGID